MLFGLGKVELLLIFRGGDKSAAPLYCLCARRGTLKQTKKNRTEINHY